MRRGWLFLFLLMGLAVPGVKAQISAYGEFSSSQFTDAPKGDYLYGGTAGVLVDGPKLFKHVLLSAKIQGRFVSNSGVRFDGVSVGPRFSIAPVVFRLAPFVDFNVGYARFNTGAGGLAPSSTDNTLGTTGGVTRQITSHVDVVVDYTYEYFGYNFNQYTPQTYSAGLVYRFSKR